MKLQKKDLMIVYHSENRYTLSVRKRILFFFYRWIPLTYHVAENTAEEIMEFSTFEEAEKFVENIL